MASTALLSLLPGALALGDLHAYSHSSQPVAVHPDWMAGLDDGALLSELSLPGSHDSLSLRGGDAVATQSMGLAEQLRSGVRALDVRCAHVKNACAVHHGIVDQKIDLDSVLHTLADFLAVHPTEAVLMRMGNAGTRAHGNNRSWEETWQAYAQKPRFRQLLWPEPGHGCHPCPQNPALRDIRGRVVVLQDFGQKWPACYGIPYPDVWSVQDDWELRSNWELPKKWVAASAHLDRALHGSRQQLFMSYLSAAAGAFPYFVASGQASPDDGAPLLSTGHVARAADESWADFPKEHCALGWCEVEFAGINALAARQLLQRGPGRAGVVMADFPGPDLLRVVIEQNRQRSAALLL